MNKINKINKKIKYEKLNIHLKINKNKIKINKILNI